MNGIKTWGVENPDGKIRLTKAGTAQLFRTRADAASVAKKAKGKVLRIELVATGR